MRSLLPKNATDFELALEEVISTRMESLPVPYREMWNAHACPVSLLPWLAHSLGVDRWPDNYTESQKREAIAGSVDIYRRRGTLGAIKRVLVIEGFDVTVHENAHGPFTMSLELDDNEGNERASREEVESIAQAVFQVKNARTHFVGIAINDTADFELNAGMTVALHSVTNLILDTWQDNLKSDITAGGDTEIIQKGTESPQINLNTH